MGKTLLSVLAFGLSLGFAASSGWAETSGGLCSKPSNQGIGFCHDTSRDPANFVTAISFSSDRETPVGKDLYVDVIVKTTVAGANLSHATTITLEIFTPDGHQTKTVAIQGPENPSIHFTSYLPGDATIKAYASFSGAPVYYSSYTVKFTPKVQKVHFTQAEIESDGTLTFKGTCENVAKVVLQMNGMDTVHSVSTQGQSWRMTGIPRNAIQTHPTEMFHSENGKASSLTVNVSCSGGACTF